MLLLGDNAFLGTALSCEYSGNSYDLSVFRQLWNNHTKRISLSQEKQNHFFSHGGIFRAYSSLLGKYQKVSLKLTARAVPHEFPHHISSVRCRKYFVEYFAHCLTLSLCRDYRTSHVLCTNLRENEGYTLRWRTFQTISLLYGLCRYQHQFLAF